MKHPHRTQFSAGTDEANRAAALALVEKLTAGGHQAEVDPEIPTAVDHDAPPDVHDAAIAEVEGGAPAPAPEALTPTEPPFTQEDPTPHRAGRRKDR